MANALLYNNIINKYNTLCHDIKFMSYTFL